MQKSVLLLFSVLLFSCGKDSVLPDLGLDYYPIELGSYRIYDVEETTYLNKVPTSESYQLRESFIEEIMTEGELSYLLRIERRNTTDDPWLSIKSVYIRQSNFILEYRENNVSNIAMSYPVKVGRTWDGNGLNSDAEVVYRYEEGMADNFEVDQVKVVIRDLPPNIVEQDQRYEIFGRGTGLIERNFTTIEYCQSGCSGVNEPDNGVILVQQLVEYGKE